LASARSSRAATEWSAPSRTVASAMNTNRYRQRLMSLNTSRFAPNRQCTCRRRISSGKSAGAMESQAESGTEDPCRHRRFRGVIVAIHPQDKLNECVGLLSPTWNHAQANRRTSAGFSGPPDEERPSSLAVRQPACELSIPFAVLVQARRKQRGARG